VKFGFNVQIGWVVERKKTNEVIFKAFTFRHNKVVKDVLANSDDLLNMKLLLSNKLTYYKISDFYEPQYYIGRGSSARVE
jgi:calcium-dependent protein kinase